MILHVILLFIDKRYINCASNDNTMKEDSPTNNNNNTTMKISRVIYGIQNNDSMFNAFFPFFSSSNSSSIHLQYSEIILSNVQFGNNCKRAHYHFAIDNYVCLHMDVIYTCENISIYRTDESRINELKGLLNKKVESAKLNEIAEQINECIKSMFKDPESKKERNVVAFTVSITITKPNTNDTTTETDEHTNGSHNI